MEVNDFEIVLTDVTFYLQHLQKLVLNKLVIDVVTKNKINEYNRKLKGIIYICLIVMLFIDYLSHIIVIYFTTSENCLRQYPNCNNYVKDKL